MTPRETLAFLLEGEATGGSRQKALIQPLKAKGRCLLRGLSLKDGSGGRSSGNRSSGRSSCFPRALARMPRVSGAIGGRSALSVPVGFPEGGRGREEKANAGGRRLSAPCVGRGPRGKTQGRFLGRESDSHVREGVRFLMPTSPFSD